MPIYEWYYRKQAGGALERATSRSGFLWAASEGLRYVGTRYNSGTADLRIDTIGGLEILCRYKSTPRNMAKRQHPCALWLAWQRRGCRGLSYKSAGRRVDVGLVDPQMIQGWVLACYMCRR